MKIKQNDKRKILAQLLKPVAAIAAALLVGAVLILYAGANPVMAYKSLLTGAFGSFYNFTEVLVKASPLWLAGLGVALSFKAGIFNVGAEGQIMMGALATAWIGVVLGNLPMIILLPVTMLAAVLAGGGQSADGGAGSRSTASDSGEGDQAACGADPYAHSNCRHVFCYSKEYIWI